MLVLAAGSGSSLFFPKVYDLIWSSVVLIVLLIVFAKFVMPKFNKVMDERAKKIKGEIDEATAMKKDAASLKEQYDELLGSAKAEAEKIRQDAREQAEQIVGRAKAEAKAEAEKIRQDAKADLEAQKAKAMSDLSQEVGNMALAMASKILGTELKDPAVRSSMADLAVNKIGSEGGKQS